MRGRGGHPTVRRLFPFSEKVVTTLYNQSPLTLALSLQGRGNLLSSFLLKRKSSTAPQPVMKVLFSQWRRFPFSLFKRNEGFAPSPLEGEGWGEGDSQTNLELHTQIER